MEFQGNDVWTFWDLDSLQSVAISLSIVINNNLNILLLILLHKFYLFFCCDVYIFLAI